MQFCPFLVDLLLRFLIPKHKRKERELAIEKRLNSRVGVMVDRPSYLGLGSEKRLKSREGVVVDRPSYLGLASEKRLKSRVGVVVDRPS